MFFYNIIVVKYWDNCICLIINEFTVIKYKMTYACLR